MFENLPYNISTEILSKWILNLDDNYFWFDCLILMFQKEVANRIIAKFNTPEYGRLSILANWKLNIEKICDIKPSSFFPKPKVQSSLVQLIPYENEKQNFDFEKMEELTNFIFSKKRKMLRTIFKKEGGSSFLNSINIYPNIRPENLTLEEFCKLEFALRKN